MNRILLTGASVLLMGLATWQSQSRPGGDASPTVPAYVGAIHPRISPDGRTIAFSYQGAIWRVPREGGAMTRLTDGAGFDAKPVWSPDGKQIACIRSPGSPRSEVRLFDAATGAEAPLRQTVEIFGDRFDFIHVEFHPDGRLLGPTHVGGKEVGLPLIDLATGETQAIAGPPRSQFGPFTAPFTLSRDGRTLAYVTTRDVRGQQMGNEGPQSDLWQVALAGGEPKKVTRFPSRIFDLCWSADDSALFVVSDVGGAHNDIWRVPLADPERGARRLTSGQADEASPSVSADGHWLVYSDNRQGATALVVRDLHNDVDTVVPLSGVDFGKPTGTVRLTTRDRQSGQAVAARVSIRQADGKFFAPAGALYRMAGDVGHFYCDRNAELTLPAGSYRLRAFRGPEYRLAPAEFSVEPGRTADVTVDLERWTNAAERGWYSGENHIHANYGYGEWYNSPETMRSQCAGEDLRVCNFMVANSDTDGIFDREYFRGRADALSTPETILYWNQEFRSTIYGHMTLVNLSRLVEPIMTGFKDTTNPWDVPTNSDIADRTHLQQGLVNFTHVGGANDPYDGPYSGKSLPVEVALGKLDSLDLNGSYAGVVPLWHRLLNCGFRLAGSAGTDCFLNRINSSLPGGDRVYVKIEGEFSYRAWIEGLRAGRSFVTNGPMLELSVDGHGPGKVIRLAGPRDLRVTAKATSQFPLESLDIVQNGRVIASGGLADDRLSAEFDQPVKVPQSGWLSVRALGPRGPGSNPRIVQAHTSPVYVEVADRPAGSRDDAEYFLKWIDRLSLDVRRRDRIPSPELQRHVQAQLEAAREVYSKIAQSAE